MAISGLKARSIFDRYDIVSERDLLTAAQRLSDHVKAVAVPSKAAGKQSRKRESHYSQTGESLRGN